MNFVDNKGNIINVGDKIEWIVKVFKSKFDKKICIDKPWTSTEILTLEVLNNEYFNNVPMFRNDSKSGWDWEGLHDIDAEYFHVSVLKV